MKRLWQSFEIDTFGWLLLIALGAQGLYVGWQGAWSELFVVVVALLLGLTPYVLQPFLYFKPNKHILAGIVFFVGSTLVLGEIYKFYEMLTWWDTFLHSLAGLGLALLGYTWVYNLVHEQTITARPALHTTLVFCGTVTMLTFWEIYEFTVDQLNWSSDRMQPSLFDTMIDVIVGVAVAMATCIIGYLLLTRQRSSLRNTLED